MLGREHKVVVAVIGALCCALAQAACGGTATGGSGGSAGVTGPPVPRDQLASTLGSTFCDAIGGCCRKAGLPYDQNACITNIVGGFEIPSTSAKVSYDAQAAGNCVAGFKASLSACQALSDATPDACEQVFQGQVGPGAACSIRDECLRPAGGHASCENGVCVQQPRGRLGDACASTCTESGSSRSCSGSGGTAGTGGTGGTGATPGPADCYTNDGLTCSETYTCIAIARLGEPCHSSEGCVEGTYCDFSLGQCATPHALGEACNGYRSCASSFCDFTSSVCVPLVAEGQPCDSSEQCVSDRCVYQSGASSGTCGTDSTLATPETCSGQLH